MEVELENTYIWMGLWSLINQLKWKSSHGLCSWKSSHVVVILVMWLLPISSCIWSQNLSNPSFLNPKVFYMSWKYARFVIELAVCSLFHSPQESWRKVVPEPTIIPYCCCCCAKSLTSFGFISSYIAYILNYSHSKLTTCCQISVGNWTIVSGCREGDHKISTDYWL